MSATRFGNYSIANEFVKLKQWLINKFKVADSTVKETSKAMRRRWAESDASGFLWRDIFKGDILDVGASGDPLTCAVPFTLADGCGDDLTKFFAPNTFDVIHGSQVLEHMIDPVAALRSWIACLRPGGYIVATVPDFELYEHCTWPSKWNAGHRSTWSIDWTHAIGAPATHCKLPEWLARFGVEIVRCQLIETNYDYSLGPEVDQTLDPEKGVEAFIEFVLRKFPNGPDQR